MNGQHYVALVRLSNKDDETLADVGERCHRVPASSLPWLLETGRIEFFTSARALAASGWADFECPEGEA